MRAVVKAVKLWPQCNATFDDDAKGDGSSVITQHNPVHIGMAAQTPGGLMVPVIRNAESQNIWQLSSEVARIGEAAKTGVLRLRIVRIDYFPDITWQAGGRYGNACDQPSRGRYFVSQ